MEKLGVAGYLGPQGTYSEIAAQRLCGGARLCAFPSFYALFSALKSGEVGAIVLPIENSLNGAVTQNLDLMQEADGVYAKAITSVKIDHRLITAAGCDRGAIRRVFSHVQALEQCAAYLAENLPQAALFETPSTAECLSKLEYPTDAGIVGAHVKREGYELSENTISDNPANFTQFLLTVNGEPDPETPTSRIFFSVTCRHRAGALVQILNILNGDGVNMTKIESRPIKDRAGEFRFFIEAEGDYSTPAARETLEKIKAAALSVKLLGAY